MKQQGFVFIELLAVLFLVYGIFVVAVPAYGDYLARAQVTEGLLLAIPVKKAVIEYHGHRGKFPADNRMAGIAPPEKFYGNYVDQVKIVNGDVIVHFSNRSMKQIQGKIIQMRPEIHDSSISWRCEKLNETHVDNPYRPSSCK
jgi:type IV pilus assembly protein PilA